MRQSFALFSRRLTPRLWIEPWGITAPAPEAAVPNAPPLTPYKVRPGGFWQIQKIWTDISPHDAIPSVPDAPLLRQHIFRRGKFWQTQKFLQVDIATVVIIQPSAPPPPPIPIPTGGQLGHVVFDSSRFTSDRIRKIYNDLWYRDQDQARAILLALLAADAISEEEFIALFAAMSAQ